MSKIGLELSKLNFSLSESHPNKMLITGAITQVNEASTGAPCGADGKRIIFTRAAAETYHETFRSMPINCTFPDWWYGDGTDVFTGHGSIDIGFIEDTWVEDNDIMAKVVVWKDRYPDISFMICNGKDALGFSVECYPDETHCDDAQDGFLYIDKFTGTGCALLWKNVAAFEGTRIKELVASKRKVGDNVDEKKLQEMLDGIFTKFEASASDIKASVEELKAEIAAANASVAEVKASIESANEKKDDPKGINAGITPEEIPPAIPPIPAPLAGQMVAPNSNFEQPKQSKADRIKEVHASSLSMQDKIKQIVKINREAE